MTDKLSNDLASLRIEPIAETREARGPLRFGLMGAGALIVLVVGFIAIKPSLEAKFFKTEVAFTEILSLSPVGAATSVTASGYVVPQVVSNVGAKLEAKVERVEVREGQVVKKGDLLVVLERADQNSSIAAGRARVLAQSAEAERQRVILLEAERKLRREQHLAEQGVTGRAQVEDLDAERRTAVAAVQAAQAQVQAAKAELEVLKLGLEHLQIRAPIDGTVLNKPPEVGELISPMHDLSVLRLADFSSLMVEAEVPESRLQLIRVGAPTEIMLDVYPSRRFRGEVREISPTVDRAKATVIVKVAFVGDQDRVLPNMAARVFFLENEEAAKDIGQPPKVVVPASALVERSGQKHVFVVENDRVRLTPVALGEAFGDGFELQQGPSVGTRLVKNPPAQLDDGHRIKEGKSE